MAAHKRVSDAAVMEAIQTYRGRVEPAAVRIGMTPNNLRKRLAALRVDLELLRRLQGGGPNDPHSNRPLHMTPLTSKKASTPSGRKNVSALFPRSVDPSSLPNVQTGAETESIPAAPPKSKLVRVIPAHVDRLREAKFDLQAKHRMEYDESRILETFFEERFGEWIESKLSAKKPKDSK